MADVSTNMSTHDTNLDQIVDQLSKMTISQISQLTKLLEEKWGVKAVAAMTAAPAVGAAVTAEKPAEQTEFSVHLTNAGSNKIQVIKVIREITNLGLKEAKDLVDAAPKEIKAGATKDEAESIKKKILEAGGTVEVK